MARTLTSQNNNKYFEKIRGSNCSRVQRIKLNKPFHVTPYDRVINTDNIVNNNNNHSKDCGSCNDSGNCMKLLAERLAKVEDLVNNLYKLTQGLKDQKKNSLYNNNNDNNNNSNQKIRMFRNIDLSTCKLDDLQRLVIFTTNAMNFPSSQNSISPKFIHSNDNNEKIHPDDCLKKRYFAKNWQEEDLKCAATLDLKPSSILISKNHVPAVGTQ